MAARPKTLWAAIAPVIIGSAMAYANNDGQFRILIAAVTFVTAILIQVGTNYANDYSDFKKGTDDETRLGPLRVTQAGLVTPATMKKATALVFSFALLGGIYLVWQGGWPILLIGLFSIMFGVLYTAGPYPLGYNGLGEIFVLTFFGPVAVAGTYYLQALTIKPEPVIAGIAPGLFSVAILAVNNLRDISGDRRAGKKTLAVRFGATFARYEFLLSILAACVVPIILVMFFKQQYNSLISVLTILVAIPALKIVMTGSEGKVLNDVLAATGRLLLIYSLLFSVGWLL